MPRLNWNEVRSRAIAFSREWSDANSERSDKQTFYNEFFEVFGIRRASVATFEANVRNLQGNVGAIDLLWRGKLIVEHKSRGHSLAQAETEALGYIEDLTREGRHDEVPRFVLVSDFANFVLYDLEPEEQLNLPLFVGRPLSRLEFPLADFPRHVRAFAFMLGQTRVRLDPEDPANEKAYAKMCELHDQLQVGGFAGHDLEQLLVRVLFCVFAEDTALFEPEAFSNYIRQQTRDDGSDLGAQLNALFDWLNDARADTPLEDTDPLYGFRYINGGLFSERLAFARCNKAMRDSLLACCDFEWAKISPAVFGSLFQGVMDDRARRQQGAHYTSERDIMKVIRSLFLDELRAEFEQLRSDRSTRRRSNLQEFHGKLWKLKLLDPACGCGNFLVLSYRELRQLELDVIRELHGTFQKEIQQELNVRNVCKVDVDQFYGIELFEWPVRIAEVAMWLMDHQMNAQAAEILGQRIDRLPLRASPHVVHGNALRMDWNIVLPSDECTYVLGNPPFAGKKEQDAAQKSDMGLIWDGEQGCGVLDYVTAWYAKAAAYIQSSDIKVAFVSTNSISQGEQVGILWAALRRRYTLHIHFAHRSFAWMSEARGRAHVHVVIIGFGVADNDNKQIFEYPHSRSEPICVKVNRINPYLADAADVLLFKRREPICPVPPINYGSMANDRKKTDKGLGHLILDAAARSEILQETPEMEPYLRPYVGSNEFINGTERWCLWLVDSPPSLIRQSELVKRRIESVRQVRLASGRAETVKLAETPSLFGEIRQPATDYLLLPKVSSEERPYMPLGFVSPYCIANGSSLIIPQATIYEFGVLSSSMHMAWLRYTGGRLESRYQYSSQIVYNNFPWPHPTPDQRHKVEEKAQAVLDARKPFLPPNGMNTIADIYDPISMPPTIAAAHSELDRAVELCYRASAFQAERERVAHLFKLYEEQITPLLPADESAPRRQSTRRKSTEANTRRRPSRTLRLHGQS